MAKRKGRAARKQQRERAVKAQERGLPATGPVPKPQKTRRVGGDTAALALESEKAGRSRPKGSARAAQETGFPVFFKVAIGAAVALVLLYALSTLRKSDTFATTHSSTSETSPDEGARDSASEPDSALPSDTTSRDAPPEVDSPPQAPFSAPSAETASPALPAEAANPSPSPSPPQRAIPAAPPEAAQPSQPRVERAPVPPAPQPKSEPGRAEPTAPVVTPAPPPVASPVPAPPAAVSQPAPVAE